MAFGERLLELLEEKDISQKDFALTLNIAPTTLNGYIKNRSQPDFELVKNIAEILNISTDFLLDSSGGSSLNLTAKELSLICKLRTLSQEQQQIIYDLVSLSAKDRKKENKK